MNPSKLYVPDPQKWVRFYKHVADGKIRLNSPNQIGGGNTAHSFIAPVDKFLKQYEDTLSKEPPVKLVSTTEQMVDQAKSELQREGEDLKRITQALKSQTKQKRQSGKVSKTKKNKGGKVEKSKNSNKPKSSKRNNSKQKHRQKAKAEKPTDFIHLPLLDGHLKKK